MRHLLERLRRWLGLSTEEELTNRDLLEDLYKRRP